MLFSVMFLTYNILLEQFLVSAMLLVYICIQSGSPHRLYTQQ